MNGIQNLKPEEFLFRILVTEESEYYGQMGLYKLSRKLPTTTKTIAFKVSKPICKVYCIANNHSDFMGIESNYSVKTEVM